MVPRVLPRVSRRQRAGTHRGRSCIRSLRNSIVLLIEIRREEALASLGNGEKLIPLFPTASKPDDIFDKILAEIGFPKWKI